VEARRQHKNGWSGVVRFSTLRLVSSPTVESKWKKGDGHPAPISTVPFPLRRPDHRQRGWGTGIEVAGVYTLS
jgi:hypothetical protein